MGVLFVDSDGGLRRGLAAFCREHEERFELLTAGGAAEAVEILARRPVALVVAALERGEKGGLDLLAHLSRDYPQVPVIITTGSESPRPRRLALLRGAVQFVEKPLDFPDLCDRFREIIDSSQCGLALQSVPLEIFARLIQFDQRSCRLHVHEKDSGEKGILVFDAGRLAAARLADRSGRAVAEEMLDWENAFYYISDLDPAGEAGDADEFEGLL